MPRALGILWPLEFQLDPRDEEIQTLRERCKQLQDKHDEMEQDLATALLENAALRKAVGQWGK